METAGRCLAQAPPNVVNVALGLEALQAHARRDLAHCSAGRASSLLGLCRLFSEILLALEHRNGARCGAVERLGNALAVLALRQQRLLARCSLGREWQLHKSVKGSSCSMRSERCLAVLLHNDIIRRRRRRHTRRRRRLGRDLEAELSKRRQRRRCSNASSGRSCSTHSSIWQHSARLRSGSGERGSDSSDGGGVALSTRVGLVVDH